MTNAGAVGVACVAVSIDRELTVLAPLLVALESTGEELVKGCSFPAERFLAPLVALW